MVQRQVFYSRQCSHCLEVPQLQFIFEFLRMHPIETVHKTVEVPQLPLRGVSSSWTMSLTYRCCAVLRQGGRCPCCADAWLQLARRGADRGVMPQIMEIVSVIRDVVQIVASYHRSWKSWRCTAFAMWSRSWRHATDH